ncbi:hypothetical protein Tco_0071147 [Tanacetum coccineum]
MLPEWSRFITKVKLNRGLKESNFDQLYAYLKQHENNLLTDNLIESLTNTLALLNQSFKAHLPQINNQLRTSSNARNKATVQDDRVVVQDVRDRYNNRVGNMNPGQAKPLMSTTVKGIREQVTNFDDDVDDLALNVDHVFEADQCDAFDSDVDEAPTTQTMFMANLSSEDPIYDEAGPSYDSNTPFEVQDHDTFVDHMDENHEYVEDNEEHVVQSNVSSVQNDALMSIIDDMHEPGSRLSSTNEKTSSLLTQIEDLKAQIEGNLKVAARSSVKTKVLAPEYVIGTCPKEFTERDSKAPSIPLTRKKQVTFTNTCSTSTNNTQKHGVRQKLTRLMSSVSLLQSKAVSPRQADQKLEAIQST